MRGAVLTGGYGDEGEDRCRNLNPDNGRADVHGRANRNSHLPTDYGTGRQPHPTADQHAAAGAITLTGRHEHAVAAGI